MDRISLAIYKMYNTKVAGQFRNGICMLDVFLNKK